MKQFMGNLSDSAANILAVAFTVNFFLFTGTAWLNFAAESFHDPFLARDWALRLWNIATRSSVLSVLVALCADALAQNRSNQ